MLSAAVLWVLLSQATLAPSPVTVFAPSPVTVFVGHREVKTGAFVEPVPGYILDSVRDIQGWFRRYRSLRLTTDLGGADIVLVVEARQVQSRQTGSIAVPIGAGMYYGAPLHDATGILTTTMVAGDYSKPIVGVGRSWRAAASAVVRELNVWVNTNRAAIIVKRASHAPPR